MERFLFNRFADNLKRYGKNGVGRKEFELGRDGKYSLRYIPFEQVNRSAKLVIVGITAGPNQQELAYETVQKMLLNGRHESEILVEAKKHGAFGSDTMRPNLIKILRHFRFDNILGINQIESLWGSNSHLLHSTSVIPNAAFVEKSGVDAPYAGSFDDVLRRPIFRECFEDCFVPSVKEINEESVYIGLGPCPQAALQWCVQNGHLRPQQVLGAFCHPSTTGGSTVKYYLREVSKDNLKPNDPVRNRTGWLDEAYHQMKAATESLLNTA